MKHSQLLRRKFFDRGAAALTLARPNAPADLYACPICLMGYNTPDAFTLEHVPPKSTGGRPLVLTCATCNNTAGRQLDSHIAAAASAADVAAGRRPLDTRMTFGGHTITASLQIGDAGFDFTAIPSRSDPKALDAFFQAFAKAAAEESADHSVNLSYRDPHDPYRESVAWLRVAYLYAFATLGYNYILQPPLAPIRKQIREPEEKVVPYLVKRVSANPQAGTIYFITAPAQFRAIVVMVRDRFVVLPDFEHPSTLAERIGSIPIEQWPTTFSGEGLALPTSPQYLADFHLAAVLRRLSPHHANTKSSS